MYYIKNAPETLPLPEIFENLRFPLPLLLIHTYKHGEVSNPLGVSLEAQT
jgi:hypothetical protein